MKKTITVLELDELIQSDPTLQLIDVRSQGEYATGHVPKAINIPLDELEERLHDLSTHRVAILCQSGNRAGMACEKLQGTPGDFVVVEGGTSAWIQAGHQVVKSTKGSTWSLERQVRFGAGLMVLIGTGLAINIAPSMIYLAMFVGGGLTFAGLTNICGMAAILALMPWNRPKAKSTKQSNQAA